MATKPYHVVVAPTAVKQIKMLRSKHKKLVIKLAEALAINPRPPGTVKIDGMTGLYKEEVNGLRIFYKVEEHEILLLLIKS